MVQFIVALCFLALSLVSLTLRKTYFYLPKKELQRQASSRDPLATILWRAVAFGGSLQLLLWFFIGLGGAVGFVLFARIAPPVFGFVVVALVLWFAFVWIPSTRLTSVGARLAVWCTPSLVWLLGLLHPLLRRITHFLSRFPLGPHTGLYEKEDLLDFIEQQQHQSDNRISVEELSLVRQALKFDDYTVTDVLVPRKKVNAISNHEPIGPVLMDELHALAHTRFPVYGDDKNVIVGTLFLRDIVDSKHSGTVKDYADKHVFYVHEKDSLSAALHAFRVAKQQILVVVNDFEEYVGIITVSDVLGKLITIPDGSAFVHHDDKRAVAAKHTKPEVSEETTPALSENLTEVIE